MRQELETADRRLRSCVGYDVFISYASKDKIAADAACVRLEAAGIRCWIAPRDIVPGTSYGEAIIEAIHGLKVMVLVFSSNANASAHIPKEVERAMSSGVAIIPFRIEDVAPGKSLDYFIGSVHWLDAMTPPLEKHLDSLAETVRKLLPAKPGEAAAPALQTSGVWQRSAPPAAPATPALSAPTVAAAPASSSKTIWIGVAAVAVLAVVVMAVIMMRGGGNSQTVANVPAATNPPGGATPTPYPSPGSNSIDANNSNPVKNAVAATPTPAVVSNLDPIVGCYQWLNNAVVTIRRDGTVVGGPFTAQWHAGGTTRAYRITWPPATDTVTIAPDQRSLSGENQYGYPTSGIRMVGAAGLVGVWRWPNGVPVTVLPNGTFSAASFHGTWQTVDAARGIYSLTWPSPVDNLKLTADGSRLAGVNQYGIVISGVKTQPCTEN
jgi:TIR domain